MGVMMKLMQIVTPKPVLGYLLKQLNHKKWRVRAEVVDLITAALLKFSDFNFEYPKLVNSMSKLLADTNERVRHVTGESFALMNSQMGAGQVRCDSETCYREAVKVTWPVLQLVKVLQTKVDKLTLSSLRKRFAEATLPQLGSNGLVEHPSLVSHRAG